MPLVRGISKPTIVVMVAVLVVASIVAGYLVLKREEVQQTPTAPTHTETPTPPKLVIKPIEPSRAVEEVPLEYFPELYPWPLWRGRSGSDRMYPGPLPRSMEVLSSTNISANIGGVLAEPVVEGVYIYLGDSGGIYALNRFSGELVWGVEIRSDTLEGRAVSHPQPVERWRALGLDRLVTAYGLGKHLYIATSSSSGGGGDAYILALDRETGNLIWRVELKSEPNASSATSITSNMVVADGKIFVGSVRDEGYVFCVSEDGEILWRISLGGNVEGLAYGDGILYAAASKLYAIDAGKGEILWSGSPGSWPIYRSDRVIVERYGKVDVLNREGEVLWSKSYGSGGNVEGNPYIAVGDQAIYISRTLGERPRDLKIVGMDGNSLGEFQILHNEDAVAPIASRDVIVLPVRSERNSKLYILWRKGEKLSENVLQVREGGWWPVAVAAYGEVYVVADPFTLYRLGDSRSPRINNISVELDESSRGLSIYVEAYDNESALYRVLLVYSINSSKWIYRDMEVAREYFMEPVGGYGYREELYRLYLDTGPGTSIEFYIVAIDNVGNYVVSKAYAYQILKE